MRVRKTNVKHSFSCVDLSFEFQVSVFPLEYLQQTGRQRRATEEEGLSEQKVVGQHKWYESRVRHYWGWRDLSSDGCAWWGCPVSGGEDQLKVRIKKATQNPITL